VRFQSLFRRSERYHVKPLHKKKDSPNRDVQGSCEEGHAVGNRLGGHQEAHLGAVHGAIELSSYFEIFTMAGDK
jgi:hypothetical protein